MRVPSEVPQSTVGWSELAISIAAKFRNFDRHIFPTFRAEANIMQLHGLPYLLSSDPKMKRP